VTPPAARRRISVGTGVPRFGPLAAFRACACGPLLFALGAFRFLGSLKAARRIAGRRSWLMLPCQTARATQASFFVPPSPSLPDGTFSNEYLLKAMQPVAAAVWGIHWVTF